MVLAATIVALTNHFFLAIQTSNFLTFTHIQRLAQRCQLHLARIIYKSRETIPVAWWNARCLIYRIWRWAQGVSCKRFWNPRGIMELLHSWRTWINKVRWPSTGFWRNSDWHSCFVVQRSHIRNLAWDIYFYPSFSRQMPWCFKIDLDHCLPYLFKVIDLSAFIFLSGFLFSLAVVCLFLLL